jgi:hypothetical protein
MERLAFWIAYVGSAALVALFAAALSQAVEHPDGRHAGERIATRPADTYPCAADEVAFSFSDKPPLCVPMAALSAGQ